MRKLLAALIFATAPIAASAEGILDRAQRGETTSVQASDPRLKAAYARARATLPEFLKLLDSKPSYVDAMAIKMNIPSQDGRSEYFWISSLRREGSGFAGTIGNRPNFATHVSMGDQVRFTRQQIVDWTYRDTRTDLMEGNFTGCAILSRETPAERKRFMDAVGLRCR